MRTFIIAVLYSFMSTMASAQCTVNFTNEVDCEVVVEFGLDIGGGIITTEVPVGIYGYTFPCFNGTCPQINADGTCYMEVGAPWAPNNMTVEFSPTACASGNPIAMRLISLNGIPTSSPWVSMNNPTETVNLGPGRICCPVIYVQAMGSGFVVTMGCGM